MEIKTKHLPNFLKRMMTTYTFLFPKQIFHNNLPMSSMPSNMDTNVMPRYSDIAPPREDRMVRYDGYLGSSRISVELLEAK